MKHPLQHLDGLGAKRVEVFNKLSIHTVEDLLYAIPRRYIDRSKPTLVERLQENRMAFTIVEIDKIALHFGRGKSRLQVISSDISGSIELLFFNQVDYLHKKLRQGQKLAIYGRVSRYQRLQMVHPEIEILKEDQSPLSILPIYSINEEMRKSRMEQRFMRKLMWQALATPQLDLSSGLPARVVNDLNFQDEFELLRQLHFPDHMAQVEKARRQLKLEEIWPVAWQLTKDYLLSRDHGAAQIFEGELVRQFETQLPFDLTSSQEEALDHIRMGLKAPHQFLGLVQGDVGSGKTVVGLAAALMVIEGGKQVAFLAPTEILARQHFAEAQHYLGSMGLQVALLTGSLNPKAKQDVYQRCAEGQVDLLVGTHALFNDELAFKQLGLCLVDEQHRFGVEQRGALTRKGNFPDLLQFTATPIPRSLLQTLYGDSTAIVIGAKPAGRQPVKTRIVPLNKRESLKNFILGELGKNHRAYWIAPRVLDEEDTPLQSIEALHAEWKNLNPLSLPLHGQMDEETKNTNLSKFKEGVCNLLISTTVVEVGVNVPEASIIVIEGAERFGLAQLHQLRGRVGRGNQEAWCFLLCTGEVPEETTARLQGFCDCTDGFEIAELDLQTRGAGDLAGLRQSGLKPFRFFDFISDAELVIEMRQYCEKLIHSGFEYRPDLESTKEPL